MIQMHENYFYPGVECLVEKLINLLLYKKKKTSSDL